MQTPDMTTVADRLGGQVDTMRERAARALSHGATARELGRSRRAMDRLGDRFDDMTDAMDDRLEVLGTSIAERFDDIDDRLDRGASTSWVTRLFWLGLGVGLGAAAATLADPVSGRRRRAQLTDQAAAAGRDLAGEVTRKADYAAGVAKGQAIEAVKDVAGGHAPGDPETLRQKIRSEAIGQVVGSPDRVVVAVHQGGRVTLKGSVGSDDEAQRLVDAVRGVSGVTEVESELHR